MYNGRHDRPRSEIAEDVSAARGVYNITISDSSLSCSACKILRSYTPPISGDYRARVWRYVRRSTELMLLNIL